MSRNTEFSFCSTPSCPPSPQPLLHNSARGPAKSQVLAAIERPAGVACGSGLGAAARGTGGGTAGGAMGSAAGTGAGAEGGKLGDPEAVEPHAESAASALASSA